MTKGTVLFGTIFQKGAKQNRPQCHLFTNFAAEYGKGDSVKGRAAVRI